jgi:hypothetical protein
MDKACRDVFYQNTSCCLSKRGRFEDVVSIDEEVGEGKQEDAEELALKSRWTVLVDRGELDVYTCLSLRHSVEEYQGKGHHLDKDEVCKIIALVALQVVVPALMLIHQLKQHFPKYAADREFEFRIIGCVLFLYSIRSMYNNARCDCRVLYLERAFGYNLAIKYVWPAILGEVVNSFCAFILCLTLFTVFCNATRLPDLVINCIAINFIGNVDNEFVTDEQKTKAVENFNKMNAFMKSQKVVSQQHAIRRVFEKCLDYFLTLTRIVGTLCMGTCLAFVFLLSHATFFCDYFHLDGFFLCN